MSAAPAAYGLSARLARREVFRRPWRTLLVALLIAIPVAGMTVAAVFARSDRLSAATSWQLNNGRADAVLQSDGPNGGAEPPGSTIVVHRAAYFRLVRTTAGDRTRAFFSDLAVDDPIVAGIVTLDEGRVPTADGEVLLSSSAASDLNAHVGDTLELARPTTRTVLVTGIGHLAGEVGRSLMLFAPGSDFLGIPPETVATTTYVQLPASMAPAEREAWALAVRGQGVASFSPVTFPNLRNVTQESNADAAVRWTWVLGGLVLTVAGIVITSAFASGARRQLATLGQLSANGASPQVLRRTLLLQGTWTGVVGSVAGLGLGFASLLILDPYRDRMFNRDSTAYVYRLIDLVPIVVMGILATTIAALIPARTTSRIPVLAALAGRRPLGRVPHRLTVSGLVAFAGGLGLLAVAVIGSTGDGQVTLWTATAIVGSIAMLLGASAIAPALVGLLEPLASRLHGPWRFAARSLVRQRTRTGGVVAAVCATSALAVMASAFVLGIIAGDEAQQSGARDNEVQLMSHELTSAPDFGNAQKGPTRVPVGRTVSTPQDLLDAMTTAVPSLQTIHTTVISAEVAPDQGGPTQGPPGIRTPAVADASTLDAYKLDDQATRALAQSGAIYLDDGIDDTPPTTVTLGDRTIDLTKVTASEVGLLPRIVITPTLAEELHLPTASGPTILRSSHSLTSSEIDLLSEVRDDYTAAANENTEGRQIITGTAIFSEGDNPPAFVLEALLSGIALVFALFVVAASLALASAETRDERDALAVIGAAPSTMRRTSAHKAVLLAVLGAALAIPVGFLPVVVFTASDDSATPFLVFPWRTVAMLLLVVPAIIGLLTAAASSIGLRLRPVRVSTMTFD